MAAVELSLQCQECGAASDDRAAGWRGYIAGGLDEDDEEDPNPFVVFFCSTAPGASSTKRKQAGFDLPSAALARF